MATLSSCLTTWKYSRAEVRARDRKKASEVCYGCLRAEHPPDHPESVGIRLKACAACKYVKYCSRECQRKDWPTHKRDCAEFRDDGKGLIAALQHALNASVPELAFCIMICVAVEFEKQFSISLEEMVEFNKKNPLIACVNVGIEPSHIDDLIDLSNEMENWDYHGVEGVLQFHHISSFSDWATPNESNVAVAEKEAVIWRSTREHMKVESKDPNAPLVILYFLYNGAHILSYVLPVQSGAYKAAKSKIPLATQALPININGGWSPSAQYKADCLNHLNQQIREDQQNILRLRAPMRESDKMTIVEAFHLLRSPPSRIIPQLSRAELMLFKMLREPYYLSLLTPSRLRFAVSTRNPPPARSEGQNKPKKRSRKHK